MVDKKIIEYLIALFKNENARKEFKRIYDRDLYEKSKRQARFIVNHSNGLLRLVDTSRRDETCRIKNATSMFGDIKDSAGNHYDLKVGTGFLAGSISEKSLTLFGKDPTHYYICTTANLDKLYIINASDLLSKVPSKVKYKEAKNKNGTTSKFLGETCYINGGYISYI